MQHNQQTKRSKDLSKRLSNGLFINITITTTKAKAETNTATNNNKNSNNTLSHH